MWKVLLLAPVLLLLLMPPIARAGNPVCEAGVQFMWPGSPGLPGVTAPDNRFGLGLSTLQGPVVIPSDSNGSVRVAIRQESAVPFTMVPMYMLKADPDLISPAPTGTLSCGWQTAWTYGGA